jgi:hypothetical protein
MASLDPDAGRLAFPKLSSGLQQVRIPASELPGAAALFSAARPPPAVREALTRVRQPQPGRRAQARGGPGQGHPPPRSGRDPAQGTAVPPLCRALSPSPTPSRSCTHAVQGRAGRGGAGTAGSPADRPDSAFLRQSFSQGESGSRPAGSRRACSGSEPPSRGRSESSKPA